MSANPTIPFGKYRGQLAGDVDDVRYLDWMVDIAREPFKSQLLTHLHSRADWNALGESPDELDERDMTQRNFDQD